MKNNDLEKEVLNAVCRDCGAVMPESLDNKYCKFVG